MNEFFHMGGYAFYVWMSYGLTALILILNFIVPMHNKRLLMQKLARKIRRMQNDDT